MVIARAGGICELALPGCSVTATTGDHILPRSAGGTNALANLRAACLPCNQRRGVDELEDVRARLMG